LPLSGALEALMKYLLLFLTLFINSNALACSWGSDPTGGVPYEERVLKYLEEADYVFVGVIEDYQWKYNEEWKSNWHYHSIRPIKQFKGNINNSFEYWPKSSCHHVFRPKGGKYVFFGHKRDNGEIQFPLIDGTVPYAVAIDEKLLSIIEAMVK